MNTLDLCLCSEESLFAQIENEKNKTGRKVASVWSEHGLQKTSDFDMNVNKAVIAEYNNVHYCFVFCFIFPGVSMTGCLSKSLCILGTGQTRTD